MAQPTGAARSLGSETAFAVLARAKRLAAEGSVWSRVERGAGAERLRLDWLLGGGTTERVGATASFGIVGIVGEQGILYASGWREIGVGHLGVDRGDEPRLHTHRAATSDHGKDAEMRRMGMTARIVGAALGLALAASALATASAQQEPPYRFYGMGATAGDEIVAHDGSGDELGSTMVAADGSWYIDVDRDQSDGVKFTVNGKAAEASVTETGSGQAMVALTAAMADDHDGDDSGMDGDSLMDGDDSGMDDDDSSMTDDDLAMGEDEMVDDKDSMGGDDSGMDAHGDGMTHEYPDTGSGGLANGGGVSAGVIVLLTALGVAAAAGAGLGLRRARSRA